jgi:general secretion pathway protein L
MHQGLRPLHALTDAPARFLEWWRDELWQLLPQGVRKVLAGSRPVLVLAVLDKGYRVFEERGSRTRRLGPSSDIPLTREEALRVLSGAARSRRRAIGIRIPAQGCFTRTMDLPAGARKDFDRILKIDLERATPFKLEDVYSAHLIEVEGPSPGKLRVLQLVAKRSMVDPILGDIESIGETAAFVDCWRDAPGQGLSVDFLPANRAAGGGRRAAVRTRQALAAAICLLAISAAYLAISRHESALEQLRAETAAMKVKAAAVRRALDSSAAAVEELGRLQQIKRSQVPALVTLEEVSKLLPDSVWLTDLRIEGDTVEISGLASSGASLPSLFEQSALFAGAGLTAPLTLDPREDKERFTLRMRIRQPQATALQRGSPP